MPHLSAEAKHHILLEYAPHSATRSFAALAARHAVRGGWRVLLRWHQQWDGSAASLARKAGSGKARALSSRQVQQHVRAPILAANRAHRAIHYTKLLPRVRAATGKQLSLRSLQRYGKEELGAKQRRGKKRTAEESECTRTAAEACLSALPMQRTDKVVARFLLRQCLLRCASRSRRCDASCNASASATSSSSMRL
jgi:hypothetical protein